MTAPTVPLPNIAAETTLRQRKSPTSARGSAFDDAPKPDDNDQAKEEVNWGKTPTGAGELQIPDA